MTKKAKTNKDRQRKKVRSGKNNKAKNYDRHCKKDKANEKENLGHAL